MVNKSQSFIAVVSRLFEEALQQQPGKTREEIFTAIAEDFERRHGFEPYSSYDSFRKCRERFLKQKEKCSSQEQISKTTFVKINQQ